VGRNEAQDGTIRIFVRIAGTGEGQASPVIFASLSKRETAMWVSQSPYMGHARIQRRVRADRTSLSLAAIMTRGGVPEGEVKPVLKTVHWAKSVILKGVHFFLKECAKCGSDLYGIEKQTCCDECAGKRRKRASGSYPNVCTASHCTVLTARFFSRSRW